MACAIIRPLVAKGYVMRERLFASGLAAGFVCLIVGTIVGVTVRPGRTQPSSWENGPFQFYATSADKVLGLWIVDPKKNRVALCTALQPNMISCNPFKSLPE